MMSSARRLRFLAAILCGLSGGVGACERATDTDPYPTLGAPSSSARSVASSSRTQARAAGRNPFGFGARPSSARPGDYALVPSKSSLDRAFEETTAGRALFYSGAWIEQPLEKETLVRWLTEQRGSVPNALVIPIRSGETAAKGDVVLTSGPGGSGLMRAFVVGGSAESPTVRALDVAPGEFGLPQQGTFNLPKRTFQVLRSADEVGTSLVCRSGDRVVGMICLSRFEDRVLGLGFAGMTQALPESACRMLPLSLELAPGDRVFVPQLERMLEASVVSVRPGSGRVSVEFTFAGQKRTAEVGLLNVATQLP